MCVSTKVIGVVSTSWVWFFTLWVWSIHYGCSFYLMGVVMFHSLCVEKLFREVGLLKCLLNIALVCVYVICTALAISFVHG